MKRLSTILIVGIALIKPSASLADERIWLDAKINGKSAKFCFDTGSSISALTPSALHKFALKFIPAPTNDLWRGVLAGNTEEFALSLKGTKARTSFVVLSVPNYARYDVDFDGVIGWPTLSQNVLEIDAVRQRVRLLAKVPRRAARWMQFPLATNFDILAFQVPRNDRVNGVISIDTGSSWGVALPPREWHQWKEAHPHKPMTFEAFYTPGDGFVVREEAWANQISIGSFVMTGVPITEETSSAAIRWGNKNGGILGLAALKRLNLIVDGKNSVIYLQSKTTPPPLYPQNRLGAIFVPTVTHTNKAVAWVITGSPAYQAGVRNGDILLQVDKIPVTGWTDSWLSRFEMPAGTKLYLTLQRDGKKFKTTVTLREILQPSTNEAK